MVFNSLVFVVFFVVVFAIYWGLAKLPGGQRLQNRFLLLASYYFYGYWDWLFLGLILISTVTDYFAARWLEHLPDGRRRKLTLCISIFANLGLLSIFKYYDFFAESFVNAARLFNPEAFPDPDSSIFLHVILPVGISFYTFQTMAYAIDVYRRQIPAERNFFDFALFVTFFPQLVAGPIERAADLMPQLKRERRFDWRNIEAGLWLILLGFFLKTFVADGLAPLVNQVYMGGPAEYAARGGAAAAIEHGGAQVLLASIGFAFQIYGDFAGYSTIAVGAARMLGIKLTMNFVTPEFSQNPAELWRRWHSTLNRWVTDYVYIPLGGSKYGVFNKYRNLLIAFLLTGLWHGANWTFVLWGGFMGVWVMLYDISRPYLPKAPERWPGWVRGAIRGLKMIAVFSLFGVSATFFRAYDLQHSLALWGSLLSFPWNLSGDVGGVSDAVAYAGSILQKIALLLVIDYAWYRKDNVLWIFQQALWLRCLVYMLLYGFVILYGVFGQDVIYFAF